jgi:putative tryptophan/tyrosine transport system substrate-binding protein
MNKRKLGSFALCAVLIALCASAEAQQPKKVQVIGILASPSSSVASARVEAFQKGLVDLGYSEGKNIAIEHRYADGRLERLSDLAAEVIRLKIDVILALGAPAALAAKQATTTIPIVMTGGDPVRAGIVASLARPGGNVTGLSDSTVDVSTKRLELLKEVVPKLSRVAILWNPLNPTNPLQLEDTQAAAAALSMTVYAVEVKGVDDFDRAFVAIKKGRAGGLLVPGDPMFGTESKRITDFAIKNRLPVMHAGLIQVELQGGLMAYATSLPDLARRAAAYVDKILKGTKPADLPVEAPMKFELIINLKTAKQIGVTIPPDLLARATKIIR